MKQIVRGVAALGVVVGGGAAALADSATFAPSLSLDVSASLLATVQEAQPAKAEQPAASGAATKAAAPELAKPDFGSLVKAGQTRTWFMTVGVGLADDSDPGTHADVFVAWSTFIGTGLEIQLEASGWYFDQSPDDTAGAGFAVNLRWHALHGTYGGGEGYDWTIYGDLGIGIIASGDDVPPDGSSFNLSPRAGIGFTARLGESSTRFVGGVRWHHMSNARIHGDSNNPDFNAPMFYVGVQWPL
ncbi:MAG: acyloxyacyl hydrolase [Phycisphaerales bacterium]